MNEEFYEIKVGVNPQKNTQIEGETLIFKKKLGIGWQKLGIGL